MMANRRAVTLVELMVSSAVLGLLVYLSYLLLANGIQFYQHAQSVSETEEACLLAVTRLTRELGESSISGVRVESPEADRVYGVDTESALAFCSGRDSNEHFQYDASGRIRWQKIVYYWLQPQVGHEPNSGVNLYQLNRLEVPDPRAQSTDRSLAVVAPNLNDNGWALSNWKANPQTMNTQKMIARNIGWMEFKKEVHTVEYRLLARSKYKDVFEIESHGRIRPKNG